MEDLRLTALVLEDDAPRAHLALDPVRQRGWALKAVEALVDHADGDQIWQVLDYAERRSAPVAEAYLAIMGKLHAVVARSRDRPYRDAPSYYGPWAGGYYGANSGSSAACCSAHGCSGWGGWGGGGSDFGGGGDF